MNPVDADDFSQVKVPDRDHELYDLMYGIRELIEARVGYREAVEAYDGKLDMNYEDHRLNNILQKSADRFKFKLASVPVKVLTHHIRFSGLKIDNAQAQKAWDDIHEANNLDGWVPKVHKDTFKLGDYFVLVWPSYSDENTGEGTESDDDDVQESGITLSFLSPWTTRKIYDEENPRIEKFDIRYWKDGDFRRADIYYRDSIKHFITSNKNAKGFEAKDWVPFKPPFTIEVDGEIVEVEGEEVEENPFGELPIKHFSTDLPYGVPVHYDGYGPAAAISELLVAQLSTIVAQGWPARFALEEPNAALDNSTDTPDWGDDEDAPVAADRKSTQRHQIRSGPGTLTVLQGIKNVLQLLPADPKVFTDPVELYMSLLSTLTDTPFYAFKPGGEQPSGKSREIADGPRRAREQYLKVLLTKTWKETARLSLKMLGITAKVDIAVNFAPSVMASAMEDWQVVRAKLDAGVPFEQVMQEAGFAPEVVEEWAAEQQEMTIQQRIELLNGLATIMSGLGKAVTDHIIDREDAFKVVKELLSHVDVKVSTVPDEPEPPPQLNPQVNPSTDPDGTTPANNLNEREAKDAPRATNRGV